MKKKKQQTYKIIVALVLISIANFLPAQSVWKASYCKCDTINILADTIERDSLLGANSLIIYTPINCSLQLVARRPDTNNTNIVFVVPAAFTAKNYKEIVGKFVGKDTIVTNPTENETGICAINDKNVYIGEIKDSSVYYYNSIQNENSYYFQQMLLVQNHKKVECTIFGKQKPTFRRALAIKNSQVSVVESLYRMNIEDFTNVLISQGYKDAIYLDMGTWSEGYFISRSNEKTSIGQLKHNTRHQTNWLLFVKD